MSLAWKPKNVAAWALKPQQRPLVVGSAPYTPPPKDHVVVKVNDIAINPIDWIIQDSDRFKQEYPAVLGIDVAGEIVEVGEGVTDFKLGQRVIAICRGTNNAPGGAFQKYTVVPAVAVAELPYEIPTSVGVVLPLSITTAAAGLYPRGFLALPLPAPGSLPHGRGDGPTIVVWGGSSSVGSSAIQLAVRSGADVVATASPANFAYCRALGARAVYDYRAPDVEDRLVAACAQSGRTVGGAFHAQGGDGAVQACARVVDRCKGKAIVVSVRGATEEGIPKAVRVKGISSMDLFKNDVGAKIWREFLPAALKNGAILPKPDPMVVGEELRSVQLGLDRQRAGVSAAKVVVTYIS